ncbi:ABC transporter ATP-binding protein [Streptomyces sedi]|uniref:ABC transporter ATP-binding protein n=1 Tax=Streptomyces sedi TaxID=555059 RepID=A0A5C4URT5_9ACTN|nr:ABC transporter ATP-binding protein [Streptomyces sedi]TNM26053.1 ABC transporter ATP-binding protein [Streptomyces sedi]
MTTSVTGQDTDHDDERRPDDAPLADGPDEPIEPIEPVGSSDDYTDDRLPTPKGASRRLLLSLLRPHRARVALAAVLLLAQQAAVQAVPLLVAYAIDSGVPALRDDDNGPLIAVAVAYLLCALGAGVLQSSFILVSARVNQSVLLDLRGRIYRHAQALSLDFHDRYTSGRLISRSTSDVQSLRELLNEGLQEMLLILVSVTYIGGLLFYLDVGLGAAALVSLVPLALVVRSYRRRSAEKFNERSTAIAAVIVKFTETVNGIRPVKAFRREKANDASFDRLNRHHERLNGDTIMEMCRFVLFTRLIGAVAVASIVLWGAQRVRAGDMELGALAAGALYIRRLYDPLDRFAMLLNSYQAAVASLHKISGLLGQRPDVPEPRDPAPLPERPTERPGREVVFDDVRFAYRTGGDVLPRFRLTLAAGETTALVGATGAGKSTLAKLLARFYDPTEGRVLLDDTDLRRLTTTELRRGVVMVTQEAFLFSGTIAENIALGKPDATREEIEAAARAIGAHDFIEELPDGYDTDVRKRGGRISAGQRQLVAFARVLLANPAVVILDEATSSLDIPGERAVQDAMVTVLRDRTALVIAHRLSTVEIADRVLVMERGRVVEDGTPADLVAGTGHFSELHRAWRESLV